MLIFKRCTSSPCIRQFCKGDSHLLQGVAFALKASVLALRGPIPEEAPWLCGSVLTCYQPSCGWKILQTRAASVQERWAGHRLPCPCSWEKQAQTFDFQGTLPVWLWLPSFPWARSCVMRSSVHSWNQSVFCCIIVWFFSWREVSSFHSHTFAAWLEPGQQNCVKLHKNRGGCLDAGLQSRLCCICQPRAEWKQRGVVGRGWQLF